MKKNNFLNYFNYSKDFLTSVLLIAPLLILYESLSYFLFKDKGFIIRNSADVFIRNKFYIIGDISQIFYIFFLIILVLVYIIFNYKKYKNYNFSYSYNSLMLIEGIVYGMILILLINGFNIFNNIIYNENYSLVFYYSLGAGIWEEIFFRLILFTLMYKILYLIFNKQYISYFISIILSSIGFSLFHYIGNYADPFVIHTFVIRFVAGVLLCLIYIKRGLGIACITHTSYDVLLFTIPLIYVSNNI